MSARILIVEDDRTFGGLLRTILGREGYAPQLVETAEEGLSLLQGSQYDLVLSDLKLPGMSGLELYRTLRSGGSPPPLHPADRLRHHRGGGGDDEGGGGRFSHQTAAGSRVLAAAGAQDPADRRPAAG